MILSRAQIEAIGEIVLRDFAHSNNQRQNYISDLPGNAFPIEQFAEDYLGLEVSMTELSTDGSICGLVAYTDTEYQIPGSAMRTIPLRQKQVLLDSRLAGAGQIGRRRFTLAHECAHQIFFSLEDTATRRTGQIAYSKRSIYSLRELEMKKDWDEWQANALAAAILIPINKLKDVRYQMSLKEPIKCYGTKLDHKSRADLEALCHAFLVSKSAMLIRLRQIGVVIDRPISEWRDPLGIWP